MFCSGFVWASLSAGSIDRGSCASKMNRRMKNKGIEVDSVQLGLTG